MQKYTIATAAALLALAAPAFAQTSKTQQASLTPTKVLNDLMAGNARYVQGNVSSPNIKSRVKTTSTGQYPKAVILSCLDSRVPVELVFDQGIGDIFVGRVAGNVENGDQLGSMEFATKLAGSKLVMVLGHTACGAVKGACDNAKLGNVTGLLRNIRPAVKAVKGFDEDRSSGNPDFVNAVVEENVRMTVNDIRRKSSVLSDMEKAGEIAIVGGVYDLATGKVTLLD